MRILIFLSMLMATSVLHAAALPSLDCRSLTKIDGWKGSPTSDYVEYKATIANETTLLSARIEGAYLTSKEDLVADEDLNNKYDRFRFQSLEDSWAYFNLMLPKDYLTLNQPFRASIEMYRENVYIPHYINMLCHIR